MHDEHTGRRTADLPDDGRRRVVIDAVRPTVDHGRYAVKRIVGDIVSVRADIFADGHDHIRGVVRCRRSGSDGVSVADLVQMPNDEWAADVPVDAAGRYEFALTAWIDHYDTWVSDLAKRVEVDSESDVDLAIGAALIESAARRARAGGALAANTRPDDATRLESVVRLLRDRDRSIRERAATALDHALIDVVKRYPDRSFEVATGWYPIVVDPPNASFSSWYELFPRSTADEPGRHGTLADTIRRLDYIADLGFDVVYLPPIHPIGRSYRKGPNNTLVADESDPGSPWAIGGPEGGHTAIHPQLGTDDDLARLVAAARERGILVALDIAFQCSPDHPWVTEHPEWFVTRPDGSIQYAENPPKKYQDIYPINFESEQWRSLWIALKGVFEHWIERGVTVFRVDNPHTKSFPFWEWCIASLKADCPEVVFLAEAFTRPKRMYGLAKLGFSQSYTYFTWRTDAAGLRDYMTELTSTDVVEFFRPNFWPNTPDILHDYLQRNGRPGFMIRVALAATLTANYGIYGPAYELLESEPREEGSEEYLDSEKYQVREWDLTSEQSIAGYIARLNRIRRDHPALQHDRSLRFHATDNEEVLAYSKTATADGRTDVVFTVANLNARHTRTAKVEFSPAAVGLHDSRPFRMRELLTDHGVTWKEYWNRVRLDPFHNPVQVYHLIEEEDA